MPDFLTELTTPLAGLHACLRYAKDADFLVTVPSDTPFLPLDLAFRLVEAATIGGAAIARSADQDHYIIGAWKTELVAEIETAVQRDGLFRVKDWARHTAAKPVTWSHLPYDPFLNINTPDDLQLATAIASAHS